MKKNSKLLVIFILSLVPNISGAQGFLHRDNTTIVDGSGNEIILRGIGLGNFMVQEGYMMQTEAFANTQHEVRSKIESVIGKENTDTFYAAWLKNSMRKIDVDSIKAFGFNCIRLPLHYNLFTLPIEKETVAGQNTWLTTGFTLVDSLLSWCKANQVYLILDLHATPGGQGNDAAISDYDPTKPHLWENADNRSKAIALWKKIAEKYENENWIGGYDLINETNWDFKGSTMFKTFYLDLTKAIREVDKNHILFIEGNWFANDFTGLTTPWDENMAYSFHKYWATNDIGAIQGYINLRKSSNRPIWCGESGENSNSWYTSAIKQFEDNKIGWAWWTWKKFGSTSGTNSVKVTPEYISLKNYWQNGGTKPSVASAKKTLMQMAENLKFENCINNKSVVDAMFRQVQTYDTKPYIKNTIPGTLFAVNYDFGRYNAAYFDTDTADYHVTSGTWTGWNLGYAYRNDGVDIEPCTDALKNTGFSVGWTVPGEWIKYTVNVDSTMAYKVTFRYAGQNATTTMHLEQDGVDITGPILLGSTSGWATWKSIDINNVILSKGLHSLKLFTDAGGCNINFLAFDYAGKVSDVPGKILSAFSSVDGSEIILSVNKDLIDTLKAVGSEFSVKANTIAQVINEVILGNNSKQVIVKLQNKVSYGDKITLSYSGNSLVCTDETGIEPVTDLVVKNNLLTRFTIPAKIEAESYIEQSGLVSETCNEGGLDMGHTNAGDYMDYYIKVVTAGSYEAECRIATPNSGGIIELILIDETNKKTSLGTINVSNTGGWQAWKSVKGSITLPEGDYTLRVSIKNPEFNINWLKISLASTVSTLKNDRLDIFPNPCNDYLNVKVPQEISSKASITITDMTGKTIYNLTSHFFNEPVKINVSQFSRGVYFLSYNGSTNSVSKFIVSR